LLTPAVAQVTVWSVLLAMDWLALMLTVPAGM